MIIASSPCPTKLCARYSKNMADWHREVHAAHRGVMAVLRLAILMAALASPAPATASIARTETLYADWLDATSALATVDSGYTNKVAGLGHGGWTSRLRVVSAQLDLALKGMDSAALSPENA